MTGTTKTSVQPSTLSARVATWWKNLTQPDTGVREQAQSLHERVETLEAQCHDLESRLQQSELRARERSELLYELQQHYSSEHFNLQESMRNLKIERLRNAGAYADRDVILGRAIDLQKRIQALKERLQTHEPVDDWYFDDAPIVREESSSHP